MKPIKITISVLSVFALFIIFSFLDARVSQSKDYKDEVVQSVDRVEINSLGVSREIVWSVDPWNPDEFLPIIEKSVAHAKQSSLPGETGTVYLFGHSSTDNQNLDPVFWNLYQVGEGDQINVYFNEVKYVYSVKSVSLVSQFDIDYILSSKMTSGESLVVQSCDLDPYSGKRLLVFADRVYN